MAKVAWIFPGQGAQYVGMGHEVYERYIEAQQIFDTADRVLGYPLRKLCFEGEEAQLKRTENTQPALLTTSIALLEVFKQKEVPVDYVAGHSVGEYSALVAAGALTFEDALRLVRLRGQLMAQAVPAGQGGMAAVLGMEREALAAVCQEVTRQGQTVEIANLNSPGQIVISGTAEGVAQAGELARARGARRVMALEVSGPFHSSLMQPAAERLAQLLSEVSIRPARVPVVANVSALPVYEPQYIRDVLRKQVASPVRWEDSVRWMLEQGVNIFVEVGPGTVLSGLVKKVQRAVTTINVEDCATLEKAWKHFV